MNELPEFDGFGGLSAAFHEGKEVLVHWTGEFVQVLEFSTQKLVAKTSFKMVIAKVHVPRLNPGLGLRFVVLTEDQFAHLVVLKQGSLKVAASFDTGEGIMLKSVLLLDDKLRSYVLFENGQVVMVSTKGSSKFKTAFPPASMTKIHKFVSFETFEGQKLVAPNSAAFFAYHYAGSTCQITSWLLKFDTKSVLNGPYSLQVSPYSIYLNPYYYVQNNEVWSVLKKKSIGPLISDVCCCSRYPCREVLICDAGGNVSKIDENGVKKFETLKFTPSVIEFNGKSFVAFDSKGRVGKNNVLPRTARITSLEGLCFLGGFPRVTCFPLITASRPAACGVSFSEKNVSSKSGGKWGAPAEIVAFSSYRVQNYDFFVAATAATVHILKAHLKNPSILGVSECNWECPVAAVALNSRLYAVAGIDNKITVQQYSGEAYSFAFESSLCLTMSMSDATLATGFTDGSFILTSLADKQSLLTIRPFRVPVKELFHVGNDRVLVKWGGAAAEVTPKSIDWVEAPKCEGGLYATCSKQGAMSVVLGDTVDVYSFPDQNLLARVPQKAIAVSVNKRRTYILTVRHELVVLYFHQGVRVDTKFIVDVVQPVGLVAAKEIAYVVCQKEIVAFNKEGKAVGRLELPTRPRFYDRAGEGVFFVFNKVVWFVTEGEKVTKINIDAPNASMFAAVDDKRFCYVYNGRVILCDLSGPKITSSALAKCEKRVVAMCKTSTEIAGADECLVALFEDNTVSKWKLPAKNAKT